MEASGQVKAALLEGRKVRIQCPGHRSLQEGRELVKALERSVGFTLSHVQRLGENPDVIVWRFQSSKLSMTGHEVSRYEC